MREGRIAEAMQLLSECTALPDLDPAERVAALKERADFDHDSSDKD